MVQVLVAVVRCQSTLHRRYASHGCGFFIRTPAEGPTRSPPCAAHRWTTLDRGLHRKTADQHLKGHRPALNSQTRGKAIHVLDRKPHIGDNADWTYASDFKGIITSRKVQFYRATTCKLVQTDTQSMIVISSHDGQT